MRKTKIVKQGQEMCRNSCKAKCSLTITNECRCHCAMWMHSHDHEQRHMLLCAAWFLIFWWCGPCSLTFSWLAPTQLLLQIKSWLVSNHMGLASAYTMHDETWFQHDWHAIVLLPCMVIYCFHTLLSKNIVQVLWHWLCDIQKIHYMFWIEMDCWNKSRS